MGKFDSVKKGGIGKSLKPKLLKRQSILAYKR